MATATSDSSKSAIKSPLACIVVGSGALLLAVVAYLSWGMLTIGPGMEFFFEFYLGWLLAAALGLAGVVVLLIGIVAAGVRLAMRS